LALGWLAVCLPVSSTVVGQKVDQPPEVIPLEELPPETSDVIKMRRALESEIDALSLRMFEMNDWMYLHPETGHREIEATRMLASELEQNGFQVTFGVEDLDPAFNREIEDRYGAQEMPTALVAKYGGKAEHPVVAFVFEVDALRADRGAFHGCQHNQQGASMVTAAIALSKVLAENDRQGAFGRFTPRPKRFHHPPSLRWSRRGCSMMWTSSFGATVRVAAQGESKVVSATAAY
jgi:hypothetical protein